MYRGRRTGGLRVVFPNVEQHVAKRVPHLSRSPQPARVVAARQDLPRELVDPLHRIRNARRDRLHPSPQRHMVVRLDDEVQVIPLNRVVSNSEAGTFTRRSKRGPNL